MGDNLYVSDLPPTFTEEQLYAVFGAYGIIARCKLLPPMQPGQKACALIQYKTPDEAKWLVENLNGNIPEGLAEPIGVRFANSDSKGQKGVYGKACGVDWGKGGCGCGDWGGCAGWGGPYDGKGGKGGSKGKGGCSVKTLFDGLLAAGALPGGRWTNDEATLFVGGLPWDTTDTDLYKIFSSFGALAPRGVRAMQNEDGSCKGIGFVNFTEVQSATTAIMTLNGTTMPDGSVLTVSIKRPKVPDPSKGMGKGVPMGMGMTGPMGITADPSMGIGMGMGMNMGMSMGMNMGMGINCVGGMDGAGGMDAGGIGGAGCGVGAGVGCAGGNDTGAATSFPAQ